MTENETIFQKSSASETWYCEDTIKLPNRAMSYGDGLFETMIWDNDSIRFFDKHLQRLMGGMKALTLDFSMIKPNELILLLQRKFPGKRKRLRWTVFRAGGGKYTPQESAVIQLLQISEATAVPHSRIQTDVSQNVQLFPTLWSRFKTLNSLSYIMANKEKNERGLDEIILLDHRGNISEASMANIFWVNSGKYFTPSLNCGCINGISRQVLIETLEIKSNPVEVGEFKLEGLYDADQVFITNSSGISYLDTIINHKFSTEPIELLTQIFD